VVKFHEVLLLLTFASFFSFSMLQAEFSAPEMRCKEGGGDWGRDTPQFVRLIAATVCGFFK
jgi:hypothetical protein